MDLYIQIIDNKPFEHPIPDWNMKQFFPNVNPEDPPKGFARFHRQNPPELTSTQIIDNITYELNNYYSDLYKTRTWSDVYHIRELTEEELQNKNKNINSIPPKPNDGKNYHWNQQYKKWVDNQIAIDIFLPSYMKHNFNENMVLSDLNAEQKKELDALTIKYNKIVSEL
jgi:hypothetical protein